MNQYHTPDHIPVNIMIVPKVSIIKPTLFPAIPSRNIQRSGRESSSLAVTWLLPPGSSGSLEMRFRSSANSCSDNFISTPVSVLFSSGVSYPRRYNAYSGKNKHNREPCPCQESLSYQIPLKYRLIWIIRINPAIS